jgi:hypothetical protein
VLYTMKKKFAPGSDRFQPSRKLDVPEVDPIPGIKYSHLNISGPQKDGVFGTFVSLIMLQDKNRMVALPVTLKGRGGGWTQNLMIILKILRKSNRKSIKYLFFWA